MPRPDSGRETSVRPADPDDRRSTAAYIAALAAEMRGMAQKAGLPTLGYLLDIARMEAEDAAATDRRDEPSVPALEQP